MTHELLAHANALNNRIKNVEALLEQIDLTDPSGVDEMVRISPIIIHTGMAQSIQFEVLPTDPDIPVTEEQQLDARIHEYITKILKDYLRRLKEMFDKLS